MLSITKEFTFHAAHRLYCSSFSPEENRRVYGPCATPHGHTYRLLVTLVGRPDVTGMIVNFSDLEGVVRRAILDRYDHADLNALEEFLDLPTTAEHIAARIFAVLDPLLASERHQLHRVSVYETPTACATVTRDA